jgi:biotin transport system substrate-specific component
MRNEMTGSALAPALWPERVNPVVRNVSLIVIGVALLTLSAKIRVPFWPVPMTLQTFAVMALAAAYGSRLGVATVVAYLAAGLAGLPVFAGTSLAGPTYFLGTTGGFLVGFIIAAYVVGLAADRGWDRSPIRLGAAMIVGDAIVFLLGFIWLAWFAQLSSGATGIGAESAWINGVRNFLLADALKIAIAALAIPAGWALLSRNRGL